MGDRERVTAPVDAAEAVVMLVTTGVFLTVVGGAMLATGVLWMYPGVFTGGQVFLLAGVCLIAALVVHVLKPKVNASA